MDQLTIQARVENLQQVLDFVNEHLERADCPLKSQVQLDIAVEEIFVNIAHYAYQNTVGDASIFLEVEKEPVTVNITFMDSGIPYDPLARQDPDVTLSAEERDIGGLGIYMVKKSMDDVSYEYKDGKNVLKIQKRI